MGGAERAGRPGYVMKDGKEMKRDLVFFESVLSNEMNLKTP